MLHAFLQSLLFAYSVEIGTLPTVQSFVYETENRWQYAEDRRVYFSELSFSLESSLFYASGNVTTHAVQASSTHGFCPFRSLYGFATGMRYSYFELGYEHGCHHTTIATSRLTEVPRFDYSYDKVFVKMSVSHRLF